MFSDRFGDTALSAKRPTVSDKVGGACTPDIWERLARVFDAWGFDRCLSRTDWTRAFAVLTTSRPFNPSSSCPFS
jgi:L-fuconolactonase